MTSIRSAWEAARERAGLADLHLADLRHEAASRLEDAGVPTTYVSKFLGHRNLSTTTRYLNATIRGCDWPWRSWRGLEPPRYCYRQPLKLEDVVIDAGRPRKIGVGLQILATRMVRSLPPDRMRPVGYATRRTSCAR